jgi:hypothetical protein
MDTLKGKRTPLSIRELYKQNCNESCLPAGRFDEYIERKEDTAKYSHTV